MLLLLLLLLILFLLLLFWEKSVPYMDPKKKPQNKNHLKLIQVLCMGSSKLVPILLKSWCVKPLITKWCT